MHSHGSPGPAADGLPLSEHQPVCGEFPQDGAQAAGVRQTQSADPRNQLCEFKEFYSFAAMTQLNKENPAHYKTGGFVPLCTRTILLCGTSERRGNVKTIYNKTASLS